MGDTYSYQSPKQQPDSQSGQTNDAEGSNSVRRKTILVLAANPIESTRLALDQEVREIEEGLRRSKHRDLFKVEQRWAVRAYDLRRALLDVEPQIVHFCGHGTPHSAAGSTTDASRKLSVVAEEVDEGGIVLEDETGKATLVKGQALTNLFSLFKDQLDCVVLNSCYSEAQAELIVQQIPIVIGMKREIGDRAAIEFSRGFYDALGAGRSIDAAFEFGCNAIDLQNIPEHLTPVIKHRIC
ncbi:MAG: CHAT domain-containing protein [Elainella sp. C42_A2020_010]|nr:CHAT domain-containing protein [Elainella sp. C42_A2020_010]RNJ66440.1 MAG: CHAT domain-containing protein [Leptolyngbya sp. IPPAS B-1204]